jgi:hypothetical protein
LEIRHLFYTFAYMKVETESLKTVGNYAERINRNRSRIYQLINEGRLKTVKIDGVTFVQVDLKK